MESKLQKKIIRDLKRCGWMVVKLIMTNTPGIPDLLCMRSGVSIWIECKSKGKKAEALQTFRHRQLISKGFQVFVIDDWDQYIEIRNRFFILG